MSCTVSETLLVTLFTEVSVSLMSFVVLSFAEEQEARSASEASTLMIANVFFIFVAKNFFKISIKGGKEVFDVQDVVGGYVAMLPLDAVLNFNVM